MTKTDIPMGLVAECADVCATHATGTAERDAAVLLLEASASPGSTVGADKGYDVARFVADVRVRVPRRQLRDRRHPKRSASGGSERRQPLVW